MSEEVYVFPVSFAQQRLWFLDQLWPGNAFYNVDAAIPLARRVDAAVMERSLNEIVRRHEILRTTFKAVDGEPYQVVSPNLHLPLRLVDLREIPASDRETRALELATGEARRPFDLAAGPLLRTCLVQLAEEEFIFVLTMHHIICDGWSMGILLRELSTIYDAFAAGQEHHLPDPPVQYADFAVTQRQWLEGPQGSKDLAYWKQQLANVPVLSLPADRPQPEMGTYEGARHPVVISEALHSALRTLSRQEGVTLFMTLLAAFHVLLFRHSGEEDIVVGTPVAGRNQVEVEDLVGCFVNLLVLRANLGACPTFRELLKRVREMVLDAQEHQNLPFEKLVQELQPERDAGQNPLFQVSFQLFTSWEPADDYLIDEGDFEDPGDGVEESSIEPNLLDGSPLEIDRGTAAIDFALDLWELPHQIEGVFEYSTDRFDASTVSRLASQYIRLLEGIVADPDLRISDIPMLTEPERRQVLVDWNNTGVDYPGPELLHQLIEAQAARTPDAVALIFGEQQLTYRELNRRSNQLAHYLQSAGAGPEAMIGLCIERSVEMIVGLLGILKAGAAYVPLDPSYPKERLAFYLQDAAPILVLTRERLLSSLPEESLITICLDSPANPFGGCSGINPDVKVHPYNLAYVIYTSGSTGKPKAVMVHHQAVRNHLLWMQDAFPLDSSDRVPQKYSFSFDASVWEIFGPLLAGAQLIIAPPDEHFDIGPLLDLMDRHQVTVLDTVPSLLRVLLEEQRFLRCRSLRRVTCGGEPLPPELQTAFFARMPAELNNVYGPTEATIGATSWRCHGSRGNSVVPIGNPIANTQVYILDRDLNPAPVGAPGELFIGGIALARGYWRRPDLTADRFLPDPFSGTPGGRLYRTGDLARYLPDGSVEYLGRVDQQVKIRGFRIELGEVETVLQRHSAVRACAVTSAQDASGKSRLEIGRACRERV